MGTLGQAPSDGDLKDDAEDSQLKWQTSIRLRLLCHYLQNLKVAIQDGDIDRKMITADTINRIIDSTLLGTSSERLQGRAQMYECTKNLCFSFNSHVYATDLQNNRAS